MNWSQIALDEHALGVTQSLIHDTSTARVEYTPTELGCLHHLPSRLRPTLLTVVCRLVCHLRSPPSNLPSNLLLDLPIAIRSAILSAIRSAIGSTISATV